MQGAVDAEAPEAPSTINGHGSQSDTRRRTVRRGSSTKQVNSIGNRRPANADIVKEYFFRRHCQAKIRVFESAVAGQKPQAAVISPESGCLSQIKPWSFNKTATSIHPQLCHPTVACVWMVACQALDVVVWCGVS